MESESKHATNMELKKAATSLKRSINSTLTRAGFQSYMAKVRAGADLAKASGFVVGENPVNGTVRITYASMNEEAERQQLRAMLDHLTHRGFVIAEAGEKRFEVIMKLKKE